MDCFQRFLRHKRRFQICYLEVSQLILHLFLGYKIRQLIDHFNGAFGETLIAKLFDDDIYGIGTVRPNH